MNKIIPTIVTITVSIMFLGCLQPATTTTGNANTVFTLTDTPSDQYQAINLDIRDIVAYKNNEKYMRTINQQVNLKELENKSIVLDKSTLPEGQYSKIQLTLNKVTATKNGETQTIELPQKTLTIAKNTLLEKGNNAVQIDIPAAESISNQNGKPKFTPQIKTRVKGGVNFTTPEGTQKQVQPGKSIQIQGGHGNANISVEVGKQGGQQIQVQITEQAQQRIQQIKQTKTETKTKAEGKGETPGGTPPK